MKKKSKSTWRLFVSFVPLFFMGFLIWWAFKFGITNFIINSDETHFRILNVLIWYALIIVCGDEFFNLIDKWEGKSK